MPDQRNQKYKGRTDNYILSRLSTYMRETLGSARFVIMNAAARHTIIGSKYGSTQCERGKMTKPLHKNTAGWHDTHHTNQQLFAKCQTTRKGTNNSSIQFREQNRLQYGLARYRAARSGFVDQVSSLRKRQEHFASERYSQCLHTET